MEIGKLVRDFFRLELGKLNAVGGFGYAVSFMLVWSLQPVLGPALFIGGLCTLILWLCDLPGPTRSRVAAMLSLGLGAVVVTLLAVAVGNGLWPNLALLFVLSFVATIVLVHGARAYIIGWALIIWATVVPLLLAGFDLTTILVGTLAAMVATLLVVFPLGALTERWLGSSSPGQSSEVTAAEARPPYASAAPYALTVAIVVVVTVYIGWRVPSTDPTWVANAALMVIGPSARQLGYKGVQRAAGTILGVGAGIWLVQLVPGGVALVATTFVVAFMCIALMNVNYVFLTFFWTLYMTLEWGYHDVSVATAGLDRILAEGSGIVIAVVAVYILEAIRRRWSARRARRSAS